MGQIPADVQAVLADDDEIFRAFGMQLEKASAGVSVISCTVPGSLVNAGGFAHGSIAFALMDTAAAYAVHSTGARGVTSNANITYVKGAQGGSKLTAEVSIISRTRRVASLRGEVYLDTDGERVLAAHGTFLFQLQHL